MFVRAGGARRSRLRGLVDVGKRYLMYVAARNLGVMMRALFRMGPPKSLQAEGAASPCAVWEWLVMVPMPLSGLCRSSVLSPPFAHDQAVPARSSCAA